MTYVESFHDWGVVYPDTGTAGTALDGHLAPPSQPTVYAWQRELEDAKADDEAVVNAERRRNRAAGMDAKLWAQIDGASLGSPSAAPRSMSGQPSQDVWEAVDAGSLGSPVSATHGTYYDQQEFVVLVGDAERLSADIRGWSGADNDPILTQMVLERNRLLRRIAGNDDALAEMLIDRVSDGTSIEMALGNASESRFEGASLGELERELRFRTAPGQGFNPLAGAIHRQLANDLIDFTGATPDNIGDIHVGLAVWAQNQGHSYNSAVALFNNQTAGADEAYDPIAYLDVAVSSGDEASLMLSSDEALFREMETAAQGDVGRYDGKLSDTDRDTILANPEEFSPAAVAVARFMADNPDEWLTFDSARSGSFLTGLSNGEMGTVSGDNTVSFEDVRQRAINGQVFETLTGAQEAGILVDSDGDGLYSEDELNEASGRVEELQPESPDEIVLAIDYAIESGLAGAPDERSLVAKLGGGAWTIMSLNPSFPGNWYRAATDPSELGGDYVSMTLGIGDFFVGTGQMIYDVSAMPFGPAYELEAWRVGDDLEQHRGIQMSDGLVAMGNSVVSLNPGSPQFFQALQDVRESGTWDSHGGLQLLESMVDFETFSDDPARWFGRLIPELAIDAATGGGGAAARGGSGMSRTLAAGRRGALEVGENGAEAALRRGARGIDAPEFPSVAQIGDATTPIRPDAIFDGPPPGNAVDASPSRGAAVDREILGHADPGQQRPRPGLDDGAHAPLLPEDPYPGLSAGTTYSPPKHIREMPELPETSSHGRGSRGVVHGIDSLPDIPPDRFLRGTEGNLGRIPRSVGELIRARGATHGSLFPEYASFDTLRAGLWRRIGRSDYADAFVKADDLAFTRDEYIRHLIDWKRVGRESGGRYIEGESHTYDLETLKELGARYPREELNPVARMQAGKAPFAPYGQRTEGQLKYQIHHIRPINAGGAVLDLDNLVIVGPRTHDELLDAAYHRNDN